MLRDELTLEVAAGRGGDGLMSFRRERKLPKGGPDGGDGGRGGNVVLVATGELNSLLKLGRRKRYAAKNGRPGGPRNRTGKSGEDLQLEVLQPEGHLQVVGVRRGHPDELLPGAQKIAGVHRSSSGAELHPGIRLQAGVITVPASLPDGPRRATGGRHEDEPQQPAASSEPVDHRLVLAGAQALEADHALGVDHVQRRPAGDVPLLRDRPGGALGAVPEGAPGDAVLLHGDLELGLVLGGALRQLLRLERPRVRLPAQLCHIGLQRGKLFLGRTHLGADRLEMLLG